MPILSPQIPVTSQGQSGEGQSGEGQSGEGQSGEGSDVELTDIEPPNKNLKMMNKIIKIKTARSSDIPYTYSYLDQHL